MENGRDHEPGTDADGRAAAEAGRTIREGMKDWGTTARLSLLVIVILGSLALCSLVAGRQFLALAIGSVDVPTPCVQLDRAD